MPPKTPSTTRGAYSHKNPNCGCPTCTSRRRQEKAVPGSTGKRGAALAAFPPDPPPQTQAIIRADQPLVAQGKSPRDRVGQWLLLRQSDPSLTNKDIAAKLGILPASLSSIISQAVRDGWLSFDDPLSRLEHEIIPKVVDNLSLFLDQKDKQVTLETAKGTLFKQYQDSKGISDAPTTVLALKIEAVPSGQASPSSGRIIGNPRVIEVEAP